MFLREGWYGNGHGQTRIINLPGRTQATFEERSIRKKVFSLRSKAEVFLENLIFSSGKSRLQVQYKTAL